MRFPLPADTYPPLAVSMEDKDELQKFAYECVDQATSEYERFRHVDNNVVDSNRWKVIKSHEGMTTYQDLRMNNPEVRRTARMKVGSGGVTTNSTKLHAVLGVGSIEGEFNDMVFGLLNACTETLKIKSAYTNDCGVDAKVLTTIVGPTVQEPSRGVFIKWGLVTVGGSYLVKKVVRPRDFVYLESIGVLHTESGERIGYSLMHSIQIPSIRELTEYQIIRASTSICILFRQKSPGILELYVRGFVDPMGEVPHGIAMSTTADAFLSYRKFVYCGQMKKLNWFVKTKKTMVLLDRQSNSCSVCSKPTRQTKSCAVCMSTVCSNCGVTKKLCFLSPKSQRVSERTMEFCVSCIAAALKEDALQVVAEELARQNPFDIYEMSGSSSPSSKLVSPTDTIPPDTTSEFFG